MRSVECPSCGETERLRGVRSEDRIVVTCQTCDASWERDLSHRCRSCGSDRVVYAPQPMWEKGRGDQRSPVGRYDRYHCAACGEPDAVR